MKNKAEDKRSTACMRKTILLCFQVLKSKVYDVKYCDAKLHKSPITRKYYPSTWDRLQAKYCILDGIRKKGEKV